VHLFQEKHLELPPILQETVSKIEAKFRELGHVKPLQKQPNFVPKTPKYMFSSVLQKIQHLRYAK
jgi:hypothetical protein